jgi:hypothetical protein
MSATTRIPPEQLATYFDAFSKRFLRDGSPEAVSVEVTSPEWGDQYVAEGARLAGITYDRRANSLELELESGDHRVYQPREVWTVEEPNGFISAIEIVRPDGSREIVRVNQVGLRRIEKPV